MGIIIFYAAQQHDDHQIKSMNNVINDWCMKNPHLEITSTQLSSASSEYGNGTSFINVYVAITYRRRQTQDLETEIRRIVQAELKKVRRRKTT